MFQFSQFNVYTIACRMREFGAITTGAAKRSPIKFKWKFSDVSCPALDACEGLQEYVLFGLKLARAQFGKPMRHLLLRVTRPAAGLGLDRRPEGCSIVWNSHSDAARLRSKCGLSSSDD